MRVPGDVVFAIGCVFLALFALRLLTGGAGKQPVLVPVARAKRA
jgi:nitric oxide reductase subunit B